MSQFAVHRNANAEIAESVPYLLDVQSDLLNGLATRVVVPLYPAAKMKAHALRTLTPVFEVAGKPYVAMTTQLTGVSRHELGAEVASLASHRSEIVAALDLLIAGI